MKHKTKVGLLLFVAMGSFLFLMTKSPDIYQQNIYGYVDQRSYWGIPNFIDIVSNIPFFIIGIMGLMFLKKQDAVPGRLSWITLFGGVLLVALGSSYYHWSPSASTLVWDRLPMTLGFVGLLTAILTEFVDERAERYLLLPLLFLGIVSVIYWYYANDIRAYLWVQFFPLLLLVITLVVFKPKYSHRSYFLLAFVLYVLAKLAEKGDIVLFEASGTLMSGHSIKHLLAAGAILSLFQMLRVRRKFSLS